MNLSTKVSGENRLFEAIDRLTEAVRDQRQRGWQRNVDVRLDFERQYLDSEGAGGWVPLTDEYRLRKVEEVGVIPILQYSGGMYRSLTQEGAAHFIREEDAERLRVGTSDPKAIFHHEGAGRLPRREVIVITDEEGLEHLRVIEEDYAGIAEHLGFQVSSAEGF